MSMTFISEIQFEHPIRAASLGRDLTEERCTSIGLDTTAPFRLREPLPFFPWASPWASPVPHEARKFALSRSPIRSFTAKSSESIQRSQGHIGDLRKCATEADMKLNRLCDVIGNGVIDASDPSLKKRVRRV